MLTNTAEAVKQALRGPALRGCFLAQHPCIMISRAPDDSEFLFLWPAIPGGEYE